MELRDQFFETHAALNQAKVDLRKAEEPLENARLRGVESMEFEEQIATLKQTIYSSQVDKTEYADKYFQQRQQNKLLEDELAQIKAQNFINIAELNAEKQKV